MNRALPLLGLALIALGACKASTDLGATCAMTKPCTPGPTCDIKLSEVANPALDYIAMGSSECDDLVCLRTSKTDLASDGSSNALGYCTRGCIDDSDCNVDFQGNEGTLECSQLLLSDGYLESLKNSPDPAVRQMYERLFGSGASSKYCIKHRAQ